MSEPPADRIAASVAMVAFSVALGVGSVAIPLLALASGYDAATVGLLASVSAVSQLGSRIQLPWLLGLVPDRVLMGAAAVLATFSYLVLLGSTDLPVFVAAQLASGAGRALFWTASQTHSVRAGGRTVRAIALVHTLSSFGGVFGPALGGVLAGVSLQLALVGGSIAAAVAAACTFGLAALPTYERAAPRGEPRMWLRPIVLTACLASFAGGGWRALIGSYVPVALDAAGQPPDTIGFLLALAEALGVVASAALVRVAIPVRVTLALGIVALGAGLAVLPLVAQTAAAAGVALAVSGLGAGLVVTLSTAMATDAVRAGQQGTAIALAGTFRAVGLLVVPAGVAAALGVVALVPAMAGASIAIVLPALAADLAARRARPVS